MRRNPCLITAGAAIGLLLASSVAAVEVAGLNGTMAELPERTEIARVPFDQIDRINGLERKPEKGGGVVILVRSTSAQGVAPTDTDNDYTRIVAGIGAAATLGNGTILELEGTFDWTETFAAEDYEADGYGPLVPTGLADITITAQTLGDAVVIGPGDLPEVYFEGFLYFFGGTYQGWTISNLELRDFDWTLGFFFDAGGSTEDFNGLSVVNNRIVMPHDLNGTVAPAGTPPLYGDEAQNIGIHLGFGENQTIAFNEIVIPGDSESDTLNEELAASIALQSNSSGGNAYDGLMIVDNTIRVLNAPIIDLPNNVGAPFIVGIWENSSSNAADITVARNTFVNEDPTNDPVDNLQQAFRHSSQATAASGKEVRYEGNTVVGANVGISWLIYSSPISYSDTSVPVEVVGNTLLDTTIGVRVRSDDGDARARLRYNRIANSTTGLLVDQGDADAIDNWWGCNEGPGEAGCAQASMPTPLGGGGFPSTFVTAPWLTLTLTANPAVVEIGNSSDVRPSVQRNSAGSELGDIDFPETEVGLATSLGALQPTAILADGAGVAPIVSPESGVALLTTTLDNASAGASVLFVNGGVVVVESTGQSGATPTPTDNDYTRINNVVQAVSEAVTVELLGTFDWTEANAAASWAAGSDGNPADAEDNFGIVAPPGIDGVTIRAASLGDAIIQGPGDLPTETFEGFLFMFGGTYHDWTIQNLDIRGFDWSIGMFCCDGPGGSDQFDGVSVLGNRIEMPTDLAPIGPAAADTFQNVGIHYAFGSNQTISGNEIIIPGNGVSDSGIPARAASVGMQSNTSGGAVYDGLEISNNLIRITGEQNADPERVYGIWENAHAHTSNIEIIDNVFVNEHPDNDPAANFQRAFRVTSHSSASTTVAYRRNRVEGANIGIHWIGDNFTSEPPATVLPVLVEQNQLLGNGTGIWVHSDNGNTNARADVHFNRIVGNGTGLRSDSSGVNAENNWWGCNEGPNMVGCDTAVSSGTPPTPPAALLDADPWLIVRTFLFSSPVEAGQEVTVLIDSTFNSDLDGGLPGLPEGTGTMVSSTALGAFDDDAPSFGIAGTAITHFTVDLAAPVGTYSIDAVVDNETASAVLEVTAPPTADLGVGVLVERVIVDDGEVATVDVTFTNAGPDPVAMATIAVDFPDAVGAWTWTCEADPGAACPAPGGNGDVSGTVDLPVGATVGISGTATAPTPFTGVFPGSATIEPPAGVLDPQSVNDAAGFEVRSVRIFDDGFESGDTSAWSATVP